MRPGSANTPVVFLFTDIEGSTALWEKDPSRMARAVECHDGMARETVEAHGGRVVKTTGDGMYAAFGDAVDALEAVLSLQRALAAPAFTDILPIRVRCGLHAGPTVHRDGDYFGPTVNRAARLMSVAHGGQVLLSRAVVEGLHCLPEGVSLLDLGSARLRDLADPVHVYQLVHPAIEARFPPIRSLEATPNNLPQRLSAFIGRTRDITAVSALLVSHRAVSLVATGGIGKSRLALQVAAERVDDYPDGVWLVDLAPLAVPPLVASTVAHVLGVREASDMSPVQALSEYLRSRRLLLLLDNCEHLLDACASLATVLLAASPGLRILATSREPLGIDGEQHFRVPPLALPSATDSREDIEHTDAVALFLDRVRLQQPGLSLSGTQLAATVHLCTQLDGIPLAIELAAARADALTIERIVAGLTDRFRLLGGPSRSALPRQKTLRSMIDWSYEQLEEDERCLLRRLSPFAGGFTLDAAEAVCATDPLVKEDIIEVLPRLVQKSLVVFDQAKSRYRFLETIRQYATERLHECGETSSTVGRYRAHFAHLAQRNESDLITGGEAQKASLMCLAAEHDNVRTVLDGVLADPDKGNVAARICGAIYRFWMYRDYMREGRDWCTQAATHALGGEWLAKTLLGAGSLAYRLGDLAAANESCLRALDSCATCDDKLLEARILNNLAIIAGDREDLVIAHDFLKLAENAAREAGNLPLEATTLANQGRLFANAGDFTQAKEPLARALTLCRITGDRITEFHVLSYQKEVALGLGDVKLATALNDEGLAISAQLQNALFATEATRFAGRIALLKGDIGASAELLGSALRSSQEQGSGFGTAECLDELTLLAVAVADFETGAGFRAMADRLRAQIDTARFPVDRQRYDGAAEACRTGAGDDRFASRYAEAGIAQFEAMIASAGAWCDYQRHTEQKSASGEAQRAQVKQ